MMEASIILCGIVGIIACGCWWFLEPHGMSLRWRVGLAVVAVLAAWGMNAYSFYPQRCALPPGWSRYISHDTLTMDTLYSPDGRYGYLCNASVRRAWKEYEREKSR